MTGGYAGPVETEWWIYTTVNDILIAPDDGFMDVQRKAILWNNAALLLNAAFPAIFGEHESIYNIFNTNKSRNCISKYFYDKNNNNINICTYAAIDLWCAMEIFRK